MIHVNLLPPELRPIKRTPVPYIISFIIVALVLFGLAYTYLNTADQIQDQKDRLAVAESEYERLRPVVEDYNNMVALKRGLSRKIETIDEIVQDRIIWSRQLYNLSRVLPENFWYDQVSVETKRETETRYEVDAQTKQVVARQVPVTLRVLSVTGFVIAGEETTNVSPLVAAVEDDEEFSSMFELQPVRLEDTTFDGAPVKSFRLEFRITGSKGDSAS